MESMEQLITVESGAATTAIAAKMPTSLDLPAGAKTLFPEDNVPTTGEQLGVNIVQSQAASVQQLNASLLAAIASGAAPATQLNSAVANAPPPTVNAPQPTGESPKGSGLTVTDTGSTTLSGGSFPTSSVNCPSPTKASEIPPVTSGFISPQLHAPVAPQAGHEDDDLDESEDDFNIEVLDGFEDVLQSSPSKTVTTSPIQQATKPATPTTGITGLAAAINTPTERAQQGFDGDNVLNGVDAAIKVIETEVQRMRLNTGIAILSDPTATIPGSYVHECIRRVRWQSNDLCKLGPVELLNMEAALTAHQVYVQAEENRWTAEFNLLGREIERVIIAKRDNYNGTKTKAEAENRLIETEPRVRELRNRYLMSQAMSMVLHEMGERFAQFENGIKRVIEFAMDEHRRAHFNSGQR